MPRWPLASLAMPNAFIASTGNTQGIRFRINPPRKANSSTSASGGMPARGGGPGSARMATSDCCPVRSRTLNTPESGVSAENPLAGCSASTKPPVRTDKGCAASSWMRSEASGMNQASATVELFSSGPNTDSEPSAEITACQGEGRGTDRSCAANSGASGDGCGGPVRRAIWKSPSSGTQISLQTSQLACIFNVVSVTVGAVIVTGSRTSPI